MIRARAGDHDQSQNMGIIAKDICVGMVQRGHRDRSQSAGHEHQGGHRDQSQSARVHMG